MNQEYLICHSNSTKMRFEKKKSGQFRKKPLEVYVVYEVYFQIDFIIKICSDKGFFSIFVLLLNLNYGYRTGMQSAF